MDLMLQSQAVLKDTIILLFDGLYVLVCKHCKEVFLNITFSGERISFISFDKSSVTKENGRNSRSN